MTVSLYDVLGEAWPHLTIVDVGAMEVPGAKLAYQPLLKPGKFRLIGFEAVKMECDVLNSTGRPGHTYVCAFVGDGSRRTFTQTNFSMTSSLYRPCRDMLDLFNNLGELVVPTASQDVQTTRLDDVPELSTTTIDLLKIDIQGAEADVFAGAVRHLQRTCVVQTEVEFVRIYEEQPLYGDVARLLGSAGFVHHSFLGLSGRTFKPILINNNPHIGLNQNLWTDAVFVKDFSKLRMLSPDQLLKTAVIVNEMYGSVDLAQLCLAHYDHKSGTRYWEEFMKRLIGPSAAQVAKPR